MISIVGPYCQWVRVLELQYSEVCEGPELCEGTVALHASIAWITGFLIYLIPSRLLVLVHQYRYGWAAAEIRWLASVTLRARAMATLLLNKKYILEKFVPLVRCPLRIHLGRYNP